MYLWWCSLIWDKRATQYIGNFTQKGTSDFEKQTTAISKVLPLLKDYKTVVLGDREFCSVKLGNWLTEAGVLLFTSKKNEFAAKRWHLATVRGVRFIPGMALYLNGVSAKQKGFAKFNVACKWKRKYWESAPDGWFILTNLSDLESAILAYKIGLELKKCEISKVVAIT